MGHRIGITPIREASFDPSGDMVALGPTASRGESGASDHWPEHREGTS
jgi:hypothetical protein